MADRGDSNVVPLETGVMFEARGGIHPPDRAVGPAG